MSEKKQNSNKEAGSFFKRRDRPKQKRSKPIDKHGSYQGTDAGFTSDSVQNPVPDKSNKDRISSLLKSGGDYDGTDIGFTSEIDTKRQSDA